MTSERKRQANRANAQASTGPRTAKGKRCCALNARRHGLNVSVLTTLTLQRRSRCSRGGSPALAESAEILFCARRVAEAQIDLQRVRALSSSQH